VTDPVEDFAEAVVDARAAVSESRLPEAALLGDARWVGVAGETWWWTEQPGEPATPERGLWRSPAAGRLAANTRVSVADAWWAQVVLPLPDGATATRLLVHEAWHAFGQPEDEQAEPPADGFLESPRGRALVRCQLEALAAALAGDPGAAADAERIRAERLRSVTEEERVRQEWLEDHEGGAESVAWEVTGGSDDDLAAELAADLNDTALTRAFPYFTEPARRRVRARTAGPIPTDATADDVLARHGYARLLAEEEARAAAREQERRRRDVAFDGEVLRLVLDPPELVFDPRRVESHPLGTWYGELRWRHPSGAELRVTDGCVVDADWTTLVLAQPEPTHEGRGWRGPGWSLELPDGVDLDELTP
jgi:hypothetical protein